MDREALLAELLAGSTPGAAASESRFWLISGERGIGKTHLAQELYRRLSEQQPAPAFWPPALNPHGREAAEETRHVTRPARIEVPPDATPTFAWIGVRCVPVADGLSPNPLAAVASQMQQLQTAVEASLRTSDPSRSNAVLLDVLEIASAFLAVSYEPAATLGLALTARSAIDAYRTISQSRTEVDEIRGSDGAGWSIDASRPDQTTVAAYVELLEALTQRARLPTVLLLDDLQHADPTLLALLAALPAAVPQNLTVLCTADREILEAQQGDGSAAGAWLQQGHLPQLQRIELTDLDESRLGEIVAARAPRTSRAVRSAFVIRSGGNPYRLQLLLEAPRAQPVDGEIDLDPREVMALPNPFESLVWEAWRNLSPPAQRLTAIAATQGRAAARDVLEKTCLRLGMPNFASHLAEARKRQWLIPRGESALAFPDETRHAVALAASDSAGTLSEDESRRAGDLALSLATEALNGHLAEETSEQGGASAVPAHVLPYLETVATLGRDHSSAAADDVARLTLVFGDLLASRGELSLAAGYLAGVGANLRRRDGEEQSLGLRLDLQAAAWWSDSGDPSRATDHLDRLEREYAPELLTEREIDRRAGFLRGQALCRLGRVDLAAPILRRIASDPEDEDGLGFSSSAMLVSKAAGAGAAETAADEYVRKTLTTIATEHDGLPWWRDEEHCRSLRDLIAHHDLKTVNAARVANGPARGRFAYQLGEKADALHGALLWGSALTMYDDLVAGIEAAHPDDPHLVNVVDFRAVLMSRCGRPQEALAEHDRALDLYEQGRKESQPNLLVMRGNRAQTLSRLGRHDEALSAVASVYDEQARTLGRHHLATLQTKSNIARILGRAGAMEAAMATLLEGGAETLDALGIDHPASQEVALAAYALQADPPLMSIEEFAAEIRPAEILELDGQRAATYRQTQDEDWQLLFETASPSLYMTRTTEERLMREGAEEVFGE